MNSKKLLLNLLLLIPVVSLTGGCETTSSSQSLPSSETSSVSSTTSEGEVSVTNPRVIELDVDNPVETTLVAPFTVYTESGETPTLKKNKLGETDTDIPTSYQNMYEAIRVAGNNATSAKKLQVQDANNTQIFIRAKTSTTYVFNGNKYVGVAGQTSSKKYCLAHPKAYAINGVGSDYYYMGRYDMVENQEVTENVLETFAGAYNYMFSKGGSGGTDYGYRYCTADVRLSETVYKAPTDGGYWNAYIFINMAEGISVDLGLIGTLRGNTVNWYLVRNCQSAMHTAGNSGIERDAKFYAYQDADDYPNCLVTQSTKYDAATKEYSGFDDLHFEAFTQSDGWTLNITNLRTNKVSTISDHHTDTNGDALKENTSGITGRALIAASYCPVTGNVWNWTCGAALKNVVWENITLKKAIKSGDTFSDNIEDYRNEATSYELYPGSDTYRDGYSQGGYCASHVFSTHETNGTYKSGNAYTQGNKYLSFSVDYSEN